jgi:hypothetical protein
MLIVSSLCRGRLLLLVVAVAHQVQHQPGLALSQLNTRCYWYTLCWLHSHLALLCTRNLAHLLCLTKNTGRQWSVQQQATGSVHLLKSGQCMQGHANIQV